MLCSPPTSRHSKPWLLRTSLFYLVACFVFPKHVFLAGLPVCVVYLLAHLQMAMPRSVSFLTKKWLTVLSNLIHKSISPVQSVGFQETSKLSTLKEEGSWLPLRCCCTLLHVFRQRPRFQAHVVLNFISNYHGLSACTVELHELQINVS